MAANLLASYHKNGNCNAPFAIICDLENDYTAKFDKVVLLSNVACSYMDKIEMLNHLPYDKNVFIDADCLIYNDVSSLLDNCVSGVSCYGWDHPGAYLKRKGIPMQSRSIVLFLLSAALLITEGEFLFAHGLQLVSYVLIILPTAAAIFCVLQNMTLHSFPLKQCGELSLLVYCIHPILCYYINPLVNHTFFAWIIVFVLSLLLASAWLKVSKIIIHDRN